MPGKRPMSYKEHGIPEFVDYDTCPEYSNDEIARILRKYRGKFSPRHPNPGDPPSTTICIWDIEVIARIPRNLLWGIMKGEMPKGDNGYFGKKRRRRLSHWLYMLEKGYITKKKHGRYVVHEKPVREAVKVEMKLVVNGDCIGMIPLTNPDIQIPKVAKMDSIFGLLKGEK